MGYTKLREQTGREGREIIQRGGGKEEDALKSAALAFIRERCEGLRFDDEKEGKEDEEKGVLLGRSIKPGQIPYNMEKDIDRLCLENAISRFLDTGRKEDAFDVYFCYLEMFVGEYEKTNRMIELLSEYEANGSRLLMKHRDHYAHSVYVFALGLAVYQTNDGYRKTYNKFYGFCEKDEHKAAHHYLQYWGLTALFHDIGYPFELPCEQAASYFEVDHKNRKEQIYLSYQSMEIFTKLQPEIREKLKKIREKCGSDDGTPYRDDAGFSSTDELFAWALERRLKKGEYRADSKYLCKVLSHKPKRPDEFNYFMDHAYFSATILFQKLFVENKIEPNETYIDALTAILMHNSLYKFCIANPEPKEPERQKDTERGPKEHEGEENTAQQCGKEEAVLLPRNYKEDGNIPFQAELHPLAYMLMLCDELQCWDRTAYGRDSRLQVHPFGCRFDFRDGITVSYLYDEAEEPKIEKYKEDLQKYSKEYAEYKRKKKEWEDGGKIGKEPQEPKKPELKAYDSMYRKSAGEKLAFQEDIERIINVGDRDRDIGRLTVEDPQLCRPEPRAQGYLSDSNFIGLYNFAIVLHNRWSATEKWSSASPEQRKSFYLHEKKEEYIKNFHQISLEYKLSNIGQAKAFAGYLNEIGCFYTMNDIGLEMVETFSAKELEKIGPMEHKRWLQEHYDMGWAYGDPGQPAYAQERERRRIHKDMIPLPPEQLKLTGAFDEKGCITREAAEENYKRLNKAEQDKDTMPMECMLEMLRVFDGLRIYRLPGRTKEE